MIVVRLIGGLGNQLFQYAAGLALAEQHTTELFLDVSYLALNPNGAYSKRKFELDKFNIQAQIANKTILSSFNFNANRVITRLKKISPSLFKTMVFNEHHFNVHNEFFKLPANTYLNGFWQSEAYFNSIKEKIRSAITLKDKLSDAAITVNDKIKNVQSVSLHVRRGDYISSKTASEWHGTLDISYYTKAVENISSKINNPVFFIFSDDITWCKANFDFIANKVFIDGRSLGINLHEELMLMSYCQHNIIANSSFSWWGAWLNQHVQKTVIAPKNWFANKTINTNDLIPANWIKI